MQNDGKLVFGVNPGGTAVKVTTTGSFNNGAWHHVVATQGADGMKLYVDGVLRDPNATTGSQSSRASGGWAATGRGFDQLLLRRNDRRCLSVYFDRTACRPGFGSLHVR